MSNLKRWIDVWTWENSKKQIIEFLDLCEDSPAKVLENAGLNRDFYYQLKDSKRQSAPVRASTIQKLSEVLNIPFVFMGNFPFFGNVLLSAREGQDMTSILSTAIRRELRVEILAYKVGLPPSDITALIQSKDLDTSVPIPLFEKLAQALDMEITAYADNSIGLIASNGEIGRFNTFVDFKAMNKILVNIQEYYVNLRDEGLRELLNEKNQKKYSITSNEIDDLTHIESCRDSQATMSQWVAILFAIRSLDKS